jgi:alkaline phosphatase D
VLWTRVVPEKDGEDLPLYFLLTTDPDLTHRVASGSILATPQWDYTVRVRVSGLQPKTTYYFRFYGGGDFSPVGKTRTAPSPEEETPVRFAVASCQDFVGRSFRSWRFLYGHDLDFVLFLGDFIYEYESGSDVLKRIPEKGRTVQIPRGLPIPGFQGKTIKAAYTLEDYRSLYRQYLTDPYLRWARENYPWIVMWDDHEFANDAFQDIANDFDEQQGIEKETERRKSATRAFFEYIPVDAPYDPSVPFPEDIRLYRSFTFGKTLEIFVTDQRYYRSDHLIPEGPVDREVGKLLPNSPLGSRIMVKKNPFDLRERTSRPTMLGIEQKRWLIEGIKKSSAVWKCIGSPTVLSQMIVDLRGFSFLDPFFQDIFYFKTDQWDGYRSEREEILSALQDLSGLVVFSGDIHGFYVSYLYRDFDTPTLPLGVEFVTAGISSMPVVDQVVQLVQETPILQALGFPTIAPTLDLHLKEKNPHLQYTGGNQYGVTVGTAFPDGRLQVEFLIADSVKRPDPPFPDQKISFLYRRDSKQLYVYPR